MLLTVLVVAGLAGPVPAASTESLIMDRLNLARASAWARLPLRCIEQEFPNKMDHVMNDPGEVRSPRALHPAFYRCFDWHSAVHGHWMLVRLLRSFPELSEGPRIRAVLNRSFTPENIRAEVDCTS